MPIAPPRLRIRLNRPDAARNSAIANPLSARVTLGTMQSITENPRINCGSSSALNPHSGVMADVIHMLSANRHRPGAIISRGSIRCDRRAATIVPSTCEIPVTNTVVPMSRLL